MTALDAARELLPAWVRWLPWIAAALLCASAYVTTQIAIRVSLKALPDGEHWTERARVAFGPRQAAQTSRVIHLTAAVIGSVAWANAWATPAPWLASELMVIFSWLGPLFASFQLEHRLRGVPLRRPFRSWLASQIALMPALAVMMLGLPFASISGVPGVVGAAVTHALVAVLSLGYGLELAVVLGLARPAPERLRKAVEQASVRTGIKVNGVYEVDWALANALAFPLLRRVAFTEAAMAVLDDAQLESVAAHELGHLSEPLASRLLRPLVVVALAAVVLWGPRSFAIDLPHLLGALAVVVGLLILVSRLARGGEQHADATAKDGAGVYAGALETIYKQNLVPAVLRKGGAHGHLYDRLTAAGSPPSWPRPQPPTRAGPVARMVVVVVPITLMVAGATFRIEPPQGNLDAQLAIALGDRSPWPPAWLGSTADSPADAVTFERAALALAPTNVWVMSELAAAQAHARQCTEAQLTLSQTYLEAMKKKLSKKTSAQLEQASVVIGKECP